MSECDKNETPNCTNVININNEKYVHNLSITHESPLNICMNNRLRNDCSDNFVYHYFNPDKSENISNDKENESQFKAYRDTNTTTPPIHKELSNPLNENNDSLKISFLNVCGLKTRLRCPEFQEFVSSYDILGLAETKLKEEDLDVNVRETPEDASTIPGYTCFHKFRKPRSGRVSGGVTLVVKNSLSKNIKQVQNESNDILWCELNNVFNETIIIGVAYVSPEGSRYSSQHCFNDIEAEFIDLFIEYKHCVILADFNSHVSDKCDFYSSKDVNERDDDILCDHLYISNDLDVESNLKINCLPQNRVTTCKNRTNNWGNLLIELVKGIHFYILNGRYGESSAKCTTTYDSVIDFAIASVCLMPFITCFNVLQFCPLISDCHIPYEILLTKPINTKPLPNNNIPQEEENSHNTRPRNITPIAKRWDGSKMHQFVENVDTQKLSEIEKSLERNETPIDVNELIDKTCDNIFDLFNEAGRKAFGDRKLTITGIRKARIVAGRRMKDKPYFNQACRDRRNIFHRAKKRYNISEDKDDFNTMKKTGKEYKREIDAAYLDYVSNARIKVKELRYKGSIKDYWDYLNSDDSIDGTEDLDLNKFYDFFKELNMAIGSDRDVKDHENIGSNKELDLPITKEEILTCINNLKNNKATGTDYISNEYIKNTKNLMIDIYVKLFNMIYSSGHFPSSWSTGIIKPIYKKTGDRQNPDFYRPITLLSCLGKLFTSVLNERLKTYIEIHNVVGEEQLGFRDGYSTIDGAFILHSLINIMKSRKKSTYAVFVDLKKAFPSISRPLLLQKLSNMNIGNKMYKTVKSMYENVKSCVALNGEMSELFSCQVGLREGECLSPILFSFYLNDLNDYLLSSSNGGININYDVNDIVHYFHMFLLMYADDIVLFADSKSKLQNLLNCYADYCERWELVINTSKTKVMIFGNKRGSPNFYIRDTAIEIVTSFKYLGITFTKNGRLINAIKNNIEKARRAFFSLVCKCRKKFVPIDCQIELFEKCIEPILLYGCEIWGSENCTIIDKFRLKCFKSMLKVKNSTPNYMIFGELGILPITFTIKKRMLSFWNKLVTDSKGKMSGKLYAIMHNDMTSRQTTFKWMECIRNILNDCGLNYIWLLQKEIVEINTSPIFALLHDIAVQEVRASGGQSNKGNSYLLLKKQWKREKYLHILNQHMAMKVFKFRTANHRLPVETGRFTQIDYINRTCQICQRDIGDEFHYLLMCPIFQKERMIYLDEKHYRHPNMITYLNIMSTDNVTVLNKLSTFVSIIMNKVKT